MKKLVIINLALTITIVVGRFWLATSAHAQSVETSNNNLASTERDLRRAVSATTTKAKSLQRRLSSADRTTSLPKDVQEFATATRRLHRLRIQLRKDTAALAAASNRTIATLDGERSRITDPITRHVITNLRTQVQHDTAQRLARARASLILLGRVLAQANDVLIAARCVHLADDLTLHGLTLDERITAASTEATRYARTTTDLLSRLTTTDTE